AAVPATLVPPGGPSGSRRRVNAVAAQHPAEKMAASNVSSPILSDVRLDFSTCDSAIREDTSSSIGRARCLRPMATAMTITAATFPATSHQEVSSARYHPATIPVTNDTIATNQHVAAQAASSVAARTRRGALTRGENLVDVAHFISDVGK